MKIFPLPLLTAVLLLAVSIASCTSPQSPQDESLGPESIGKLSGLHGVLDPKSKVFKISVPRSDLRVSINGNQAPFGIELALRASFAGTKHHITVIGEVPLRENEVNPFLSSAIDEGLEITALHNTFLWDEPRMASLHFMAQGDQDQLAASVGRLFRRVLDKQIPSEKLALLKQPSSGNALDLAPIHQYLWKGKFIDGAYRISTGRGTELSGADAGEAMGVGSWAAFSGSGRTAIVNGDIAMLEGELKRALKALIKARIKIVSIHTHLTKETPRIMFVHFLGIGDLVVLSKGIKAALEEQKNFRGSQ